MRIAAITWTALICLIAGACSSALALRHGVYEELVSSVLRRAGQMSSWTLPPHIEAACFPTRVNSIFFDCLFGPSASLDVFYLTMTVSLVLGLYGCVVLGQRFNLTSVGLCIIPCVYSTLGLNDTLSVAEFALLPWMPAVLLGSRFTQILFLLLSVTWAAASVHWYLPASAAILTVLAALEPARTFERLSLAGISLFVCLVVQQALYPAVIPFFLRGLDVDAFEFIARFYGLSAPDFHRSFALVVLFAGALAAVIWRPVRLDRRLLRFLAFSTVLCLLFVLFQPLLALFAGAALAFAFEDEDAKDAVVGWFPPLMILIGMHLGWDHVVKYSNVMHGGAMLSAEVSSRGRHDTRPFNDVSQRLKLAAQDLPVFIDERVALYALANPNSAFGSVLNDYMNVISGGENLGAVITAWKLNAAVVKKDTTLYTMLSGLRSWNESVRWPQGQDLTVLLEAPSPDSSSQLSPRQ
ncbi:MAG: hypothetical protein KDD66_09770 [Bdellovibrionales bacterium]|nr:hypothetical protein [Bdellovibrionales bacterium]